MKRLNKIFCIGMVTAIIFSGCGNIDSGRKVKNKNSVDAVLQNEIDKSTQEEKSTGVANTTDETTELAVVVQSTTEKASNEDVGKTSTTEKASDVSTSSTTEEVSNSDSTEGKQDSKADNTLADPNVDVDISVMSSDMVYATVYQLMTESDKYVGKTIKIKGNHYSSFYEATGVTYHFALIQDAAACCSQGLEFELANGFEYPAEEEEVIVTGTFETYEEEGYLYCTLRNAVIQ